jgi:hypothetical protein
VEVEEKSTKLSCFYGLEKVLLLIREIYFLPNYAIRMALKLFPELKEGRCTAILTASKPYSIYDNLNP